MYVSEVEMKTEIKNIKADQKLICLSEAFKIYELMYQMKLLDIPRNMQELSDKEKEEGKMMYEIITESVHEIAKMHMKFVNNNE